MGLYRRKNQIFIRYMNEDLFIGYPIGSDVSKAFWLALQTVTFTVFGNSLNCFLLRFDLVYSQSFLIFVIRICFKSWNFMFLFLL